MHLVEDAFVNWFLVEEGAALTVVDTGHPRSWRSFRDALRALGRPLDAVGAVVLTHGRCALHLEDRGAVVAATRS